jgi:hypothetical protein
MSDDPRRLVTHEQWERLHVARKRGGLCAACGKTLADGETVYVEQLVIDIPRPPASTSGGVGAKLWRRSGSSAPLRHSWLVRRDANPSRARGAAGRCTTRRRTRPAPEPSARGVAGAATTWPGERRRRRGPHERPARTSGVRLPQNPDCEDEPHHLEEDGHAGTVVRCADPAGGSTHP